MNLCGSHSCGSVGVCDHGKSGPPITAHAVQMFSSKGRGPFPSISLWWSIIPLFFYNVLCLNVIEQTVVVLFV